MKDYTWSQIISILIGGAIGGVLGALLVASIAHAQVATVVPFPAPGGMSYGINGPAGFTTVTPFPTPLGTGWTILGRPQAPLVPPLGVEKLAPNYATTPPSIGEDLNGVNVE